MLKTIIDFFVYLLAVYGVLSLIINIIDSVHPGSGLRSSGVKMVLLVKNQEETIEGIIRSMFMGDFLRKIGSGHMLTVLDMGSKDKTPVILEKLKKQYESMEVLMAEEKEKVFEGVDG